jgi:hypothetical protein
MHSGGSAEGRGITNEGPIGVGLVSEEMGVDSVVAGY